MLINDLKHVEQKKSYVAVGAFDGVHRAHRKIISRVVAGKEIGYTAIVVTFKSISVIKNTRQLMTEAQRLAEFESLGIDEVYDVAFEELRDYTPERFVKEILKNTCNAQKVFVGYNFHFGKGAKADAGRLKDLCRQNCIECEIISEYVEDGSAVSSTRIKGLVEDGDVEEAHKLLTKPFTMSGTVVHGKKLGRTIGVPTINVPVGDHMVVPKYGVYATKVRFDGKEYLGVTNVGDNPTFENDDPRIETWIQDFCGDLYNKEVEIQFYYYIREEKAFANIDELKAQIIADRDKAIALLK